MTYISIYENIYIVKKKSNQNKCFLILFKLFRKLVNI